MTCWMTTAMMMALMAAGAAAQDPPLPSLPNQYETYVTCNIVNRNYTVNVHELYDEPNDRMLISRFHPLNDVNDSDHGVASDLYLYDLGGLVHTNSSGCFASMLADAPPRGMARSTTGHIPSSRDFFRFNMTNQTEVYQGQKRVNGVLCDHWLADMSNATANTTMLLDYYFTVPEWSVVNANGTSLPYLLNLTGSRPGFDRATMQPDGTTHSYSHFYQYHGWHVGPPLDRRNNSVFTVSSRLNCTGNYTFEVPRYSWSGDTNSRSNNSAISSYITAHAELGTYPGYTGPNAAVSSTVTVTANGDDLRISATVSGLPASTTGGFHIHSGSSCAAASEVGGHWYNNSASQVCGRDGSCSPTARDDPWLGSRESYTSDAAGSAHVSIHLRQSQLGFDPVGMVGKTVVVHSATAKIACGVLAVDSNTDKSDDDDDDDLEEMLEMVGACVASAAVGFLLAWCIRGCMTKKDRSKSTHTTFNNPNHLNSDQDL